MNLIIIRYNVTKLLHGRPTPHNPARTQVVFVKIVKKKKKTPAPSKRKEGYEVAGQSASPSSARGLFKFFETQSLLSCKMA